MDSEIESVIITNKSQKEPGTKRMFIKIIKFAFPSIISTLSVYSLETINLLFVSNIKLKKTEDGISTKDLIDAIGLGSSFQNFCGFLFGLGMLSSLETLCSQAYGNNDKKLLYKWSKMAFIIMTIYFFILCIITIFAKDFISLLGQNDNIADIAATYVYSLIPSFLMQFYITIFCKTFASQQIYYPIMKINILCISFHPLWCYIFFTYLKYYYIGLSIAYNITSFLLLLIITIYSYKYMDFSMRLSDIKLKDWKYFLKISLECGILCTLDVLGFEITSIIASFLPENELDAHICVSNIYNNIYSISVGFSMTLTNLIGNLMGKGKVKKAREYSKAGVLINFILVVIISMICTIFHKYIALIYISNRDVLTYSSKLIRMVGVFIIFDAIQLQLSGIIRGIGIQSKGMYAGIFIFLFIQTSLSYYLTLTLELGVYGLWISQIICAMIACIVFSLLLKYTKWSLLNRKIEFYKVIDNHNDKHNLEYNDPIKNL